MMAPQRQPIGRLQGQMRLLDAICEDLGVVRPPVRITREIWVTTSQAEARQVAEPLAEYHRVQWNLHQNAAPTVDGFTEALPLPKGYDISPEELIARGVIGIRTIASSGSASTRRSAPTPSSRTSTGVSRSRWSFARWSCPSG